MPDDNFPHFSIGVSAPSMMIEQVGLLEIDVREAHNEGLMAGGGGNLGHSNGLGISQTNHLQGHMGLDLDMEMNELDGAGGQLILEGDGAFDLPPLEGNFDLI